LLNEYSLFQIPALVFTAIVGALIACGIYAYIRNTPQPTLLGSPAIPGPPTPTAPTGSTFNVNGAIGSVNFK